MEKFFIKYKDGKTEFAEANITFGNVVEYELDKEIDYTKVDYVEFDLHDEIKTKKPVKEEDIKKWFDGKFILPKKLDIKTYINNFDNQKTTSSKKTLSVPEPIVSVLKVLHLDFGKVKTEETTGKRR